MLLRRACACLFSLIIAGFAHSEPIDRNFGRQPESLLMTSAGSDLKVVSDLPRGAASPWRFLLTIDSLRSTDTGQVDQTGAPSGAFAYRRVSHAQLLLETSPELAQGDKRTYFLTIEQAAIDSASSLEGDLEAVSDLPAPAPDVAPPLNGKAGFGRLIPRTIGIRGTLVMDREGWIDSFTFDWPDDADDDAVTLCLELERVFKALMPPMPPRPVGNDAAWEWQETQAVDGVLLPVTRTVTVSLTAGQPITATFNQSWTMSQSDFTADPVSLAFVQADITSESLTLAASGSSTWPVMGDAAPLPTDAQLALTITGNHAWKPKDQPQAEAIDASSYESIAWTIKRLDGPLPLFAEQESPLPEYQTDPLQSSTPVDFEQAVGFMERQDADLDMALQPGAAEARAQAGEGEPLDVQLPFALGESVRAKVLVEQMERQESALGAIDETTAFRVDGVILATLTAHDPAIGYTGTLTIEKAGGVHLEQLAVGPGEQTVAPQAAIKPFLDTPITFTITTQGVASIDVNRLDAVTDLGVQYILTALVDAFTQVQVQRPASPLRMGQSLVTATGANEPTGVRSLTTLTLEGQSPRVLRETQMLRAAVQENGLFTLTPVIADARVVTSYYHELASQDSQTWLPQRARRTDVHRTTADYERAGVPGTGQKLLIRATLLELVPAASPEP